MSTDTRSINLLLHSIETECFKYGLKLNKDKCEVMYNTRTANVHSKDGTPVPRKDSVTYLGCIINQEENMNKEISQRIATCMCTLKQLDLFWLKGN